MVYQMALKEPAQAPLRFGVQPDKNKSHSQQFADMTLSDKWEDADLCSVFDYLYFCKYVRIPEEWVVPMKNFRSELLAEATWLQYILVLKTWRNHASLGWSPCHKAGNLSCCVC
ncbi:unnamed protein product [Symbiodinium pilosum]|uniref:Uncharacterized protein n=1 Tax=Symbiodinium pilosum TaxID=2952 RepID=A0A812P1L5_SYMPI|nr:unnamed protein product [Symbiodinium pilosum]